MKQYKNISQPFWALMCIWFATMGGISAQEETKLPAIDFVYEYAGVDASIDSETEEEIKERIKTMVQQYAYSSDFGDYTGEFSSEKYEMFSNLFTNNARLTNYVLKKPLQLETYKYTGFIWGNIRPKSLDQKFKNGELLSIKTDSSGNYRCSVIIFIDVNSIYDDKTKVLSTKSPARRVELRALAIVEPGSINSAKFVEMTGGRGPDKDSKISLTVGALYGFGILSGGSDRGFTDVKPTTSALGLFADVSKSVGTSGKWHVWAGLGYQTISVVTDITRKYILNAGDVSNFTDNIENNSFNGTVFPSGSTTSNVFISGINSGEETISGASLITGALGIGYQTKVGLKNKLMIKVGLVPTYLSAVSKGNRTIDFNGYELPQFSRFPDEIELITNGVRDEYNYKSSAGNTPGREQIITAENNFSLAALVAPSLQIPIGFNWGLDVGVAYNLGLSDLFKHIPSDNNFLGRKNNESRSIIQDFLPSSKHSQLQARAGVFLMLK